jgi:hypothetical protein
MTEICYIGAILYQNTTMNRIPDFLFISRVSLTILLADAQVIGARSIPVFAIGLGEKTLSFGYRRYGNNSLSSAVVQCAW